METRPLCGGLVQPGPHEFIVIVVIIDLLNLESKLNALHRRGITFVLSSFTVANRGYTERSEESDSRDVQKRMLET
jgi:hypothetical protein